MSGEISSYHSHAISPSQWSSALFATLTTSPVLCAYLTIGSSLHTRFSYRTELPSQHDPAWCTVCQNAFQILLDEKTIKARWLGRILLWEPAKTYVNQFLSNEIHINLFNGSYEGRTLSKGTSLINPTFDWLINPPFSWWHPNKSVLHFLYQNRCIKEKGRKWTQQIMKKVLSGEGSQLMKKAPSGEGSQLLRFYCWCWLGPTLAHFHISSGRAYLLKVPLLAF